VVAGRALQLVEVVLRGGASILGAGRLAAVKRRRPEPAAAAASIFCREGRRKKSRERVVLQFFKIPGV